MLFAACGSDPPAGPPTLDDAAVARSGAGLVASALVFDVVETLGGLGTLVASSPVDTVAANIHGRATGLVATCGTVVRDGTMVTATVVADGCAIPMTDPPTVWDAPAGMTAGTATYVVTRPAAELVITVALAGVVARGIPLGGTVTLTTSDGVEWALALDVDATLGTSMHLSGELTLVLSGASSAMDGDVDVRVGAATTVVAVAGVVWGSASCYPGAGTLTFGTGERETRETFDATTASTGAFTVTFGMADTAAMLPAYGACPAP